MCGHIEPAGSGRPSGLTETRGHARCVDLMVSACPVSPATRLPTPPAGPVRSQGPERRSWANEGGEDWAGEGQAADTIWTPARSGKWKDIQP